MTDSRALAREWLVGLCGIAALALVILTLRVVQTYPNPVIAALLLLLVVLATAAAAGLRLAIGLSVGAMLAFNYFLLPPFHTLALADPQNWIVLLVFVTVAVVASHLSTTARDRRTRAEVLRQRADLASALLASFSHDLRTPLTSVRLAVSNLQDPLGSDEHRMEQAQLALAGIDRLTRLFEEILDMARIEADAVMAERQWVTPADIVEAAVAYVGPALDSHTLEIKAEDEREAFVDPRLTSSALAHVLENAAAYAPRGTPIEIDAEADGVLRVHVRDHGPGIAAAELARLGEPFHRGSGSREHRAGLGLGLAIARGLLAAEGGHLQGENVETGGAAFRIEVPATVREAGQPD